MTANIIYKYKQTDNEWLEWAELNPLDTQYVISEIKRSDTDNETQNNQSIIHTAPNHATLLFF